jgi:hypothetical protein
MQNGSGKGGEILDMGELSRAVMASEGEPTVVDFAPPNNPQRIQRVAELTGASIRRTCTDAGRAVIELVDQADAVVRQLRNDANAFVQSLDDIGNAHAARIERALTHLRGLVETIGAERQRMASLADAHQMVALAAHERLIRSVPSPAVLFHGVSFSFATRRVRIRCNLFSRSVISHTSARSRNRLCPWP